MAAGALTGWIEQVGASLAGPAARAAGRPADEVVELLVASHAMTQQLAAFQLDLVRVAGELSVAGGRGSASLTAWLSEMLRISPAAAGGMVRLAAFTAEHQPVDTGLRAGTVNVEQAKVIASAIEAMPSPSAASSLHEEGVAAHHRRLAAELMAGPYGAALSPKELRQLGDGILHHVAPDVADELERRSLERSEREAHERRSFTMSAQTIGGYRLSGHLTAEAAAIVREAIESLTAPRVGHSAGGRAAGATGGGLGTATRPDGAGSSPGPVTAGLATADLVTADLVTAAPGGAGGFADVADPGLDGDVGIVERRSPAQQRADALVEVCKLALRTAELPEHGGDRPQVQVTVPFDVLAGQLGAGMLDNGDSITPAVARRLACDANIIPVVLGSAGQVLDVGRAQRLVGGPLRRALTIRDGGCTFPGCDRRPRWTEGHHIAHWSAGGPTSLDNTTLLCGFHHRLIHHSDWTVQLGSDGIPEFLPPSWLDPERKPKRNHRFTLRHLCAEHQQQRLQPLRT